MLSPDEAFSLLGNETRMEILQALGEADGPLPFREMRDQVGIRDSGQFNYHLDKLVATSSGRRTTATRSDPLPSGSSRRFSPG